MKNISSQNSPLLDIKTLKSIQLNFLKELRDSMAGRKTSLPFIRHSISTTPLAAGDETFQIMVIGGSVFKKARAMNKSGKVYFSNIEQSKLPEFKTVDDFIAVVEHNLDSEASTVAVNFAYPLDPVFEKNRLDGVLLTGTKEHSFDGLVGKLVGATLEDYFWKKLKRKITFTVANDTVCLLLSGLSHVVWEKLACGIVGTGVNFAFFIDCNTLVNLESANFNKFPVSQETKFLDAQFAKGGLALFEKETAGAYLYKHFNLIIKRHRLPYPELNTTHELKKLAMQESGQISLIAKEQITKSAALIAAQIAGITLFKDCDMTFVMDGSFFWDDGIYKEIVEEYLKILIPERVITLISIPDCAFIGAAKLVT